MSITLRQSQILVAVAEQGSISAAAEQLHLSQPAVSMQLKKMEQILGIPLVEVIGRKIHLTEAGNHIVTHCRQLNHTVQEVMALASAYRNMDVGQLNLVVASTVHHHATQLIADFHQRHPQILVSLEVTNRARLMQELGELEKDLFLMGKPPALPDLEAVPFMENPLVVIAPASHPLCSETGVRPEQLVTEPFVLREPGSGTRLAFEKFMQERQLGFRAPMVMNTNEAIKDAVRVGLGLGVVSRHTVLAELKQGSLRILPVEGFPLLRQWFVVWKTSRPLSQAAASFRDFLLRDARTGAD